MTQSPFDESDLVPRTPDEDPESREWLYVLTAPVTIHRDRMLVLESGGEDFVPAFRDRDSAAAFLERLGSPAADDHIVQAMHLVDVRKFALESSLIVLTLDGAGAVLETFRPEPGPAAPDPGAGPSS
jgi:hypothetical protein